MPQPEVEEGWVDFQDDGGTFEGQSPVAEEAEKEEEAVVEDGSEELPVLPDAEADDDRIPVRDKEEPEDGKVEGDGEEAEVKPGEEEDSDEAKEEEVPALSEEQILGLKVLRKIDGVETEMTVKELRDQSQKGVAAERRMLEATEQTKKALTVMEAVRNDPMKVYYDSRVEAVGVDQAYKDVLAIASGIIQSKVDFDDKPPEEQRQIEGDRLRAHYEARLAEKDKKLEAERSTAETKRVEEWQTRVRGEILAQVKRIGYSSDDLGIGRLIAQEWDSAGQAGQPIDFSEAANRVQARIKTENTARFETMLSTGDINLDSLPEDFRAKIAEAERERRISEATSHRTQASTKKAKPKRPSKQPKEQIFGTWKEAARDAGIDV